MKSPIILDDFVLSIEKNATENFELFAIDLATAELSWKESIRVNVENPVLDSMVLDQDILYLNIQGEDHMSLVAVDAKTGGLQWKNTYPFVATQDHMFLSAEEYVLSQPDSVAIHNVQTLNKSTGSLKQNLSFQSLFPFIDTNAKLRWIPYKDRLFLIEQNGTSTNVFYIKSNT